MKSLPILVTSAVALVSMSFSGCETPGQSVGAGALTGAVLGGIVGNNVRGAAIGAGAGALAGAVLGQAAANQRQAAYVEGRYAGEPYRVATPSRYYGYVISPYRPHAMVDVRGIRPGARVVDPVSDRIFINP